MKLKIVFLLVSIFWATLAVGAETNPFKLPFGQPYELQPQIQVQFDVPMISYRSFTVPMPDEAALPMFVSYDLIYAKDSGKIYSVQARRAFESSDLCSSAESAVLSAVYENFPQLIRIEPAKFMSDEFSVDVYCGFREGGRFIELYFAIFHLPTGIEAIND